MTAETSAEARPVGRRRGRVVLAIIGIAVALGVVAAAGLWKVSASPQFCNSCHIMGPYVQAWKASKHSEVACVQCHYPPGLRDTLWVKYQAISQVAKWATNTYNSKPFAEVEDASCLRSGCHSRAALEGDKGITSARGIRFNHRLHLDPKKTRWELRCTSCHSQIVVDRHFEASRTACFVCHFKGTKSGRELSPIAGCTGCHTPPRSDITIGSVRFNHEDVVRRGVACQKCHLSVVEGEGESPSSRCLACHNQPEKLQRSGDVELIHSVHVTRRSIECTRCHSEIQHKLPPPVGVRGAQGDLSTRLVSATGER
jgi:nitrate/TMAO reductase-like tetraheme cytochrome c subunit